MLPIWTPIKCTIHIAGPKVSGKTTLAKHLSDKLNIPIKTSNCNCMCDNNHPTISISQAFAPPHHDVTIYMTLEFYEKALCRILTPDDVVSVFDTPYNALVLVTKPDGTHDTFMYNAQLPESRCNIM